jgi:DNA repair protein RadC
MEAVKTNCPNLDSESFGHGKKHYFIDVRKASNDTHFLLITSSEQFGDHQFHRRTIRLWEEDLAFFVEALSMILQRMTGDEGPRLFSKPDREMAKEPAGMKALAEIDRPREKLHALGADKLSNTELLAILLGTGAAELSVLDLCGKIMQSVKDDPVGLATRTAVDLCRCRGIGVAKAATILAAFELGRRTFTAAQ